MRPLLLLLLAGCTTNAPCKPGTVLLELSLPDNTTSITLTVNINGDSKTYSNVPTTHTRETLEIDFSSYPGGALTVDVVTNTGVTGHADKTLDAGCTVVPISFLFDLGSADSGKTIGAPCGDADVCGTGTCVDGRCCELPCTGKCEACDVPDMEGRCVPVSGPLHGNRTCPGDQFAPCQGYCNGVDRSVCSYGNDPCSPASCAGGVATLPKQCDNGTCPTGAADQQTCRLGACDGDTCLGVQQVAAGYYFACAALTDGTVRCMGVNTQHQLAQIGSTATSLVPIVVPNVANVQQLAAGFGAVVARLGDGTVLFWGDSLPSPTPIPISGVTFVGGSSGDHFCAIAGANGALYCWGSNGYGQVGNGTANPAPTPEPVCSPGSMSLPCAQAVGAIRVWGGDDFTCAVFSDGSVACWGHNNSGQLGFAPFDQNPHPFPALIPGLVADEITAGNQTACAVTGGQVRCWGVGGDRLGTNSMTTTPTPSPVCTTAGCGTFLESATKVCTFDESVCAVNGGDVSCWGANTSDQLGDGSTSAVKASQGFAATVAAHNAADVTCGGIANYAVIVDRADRYLVGWGDDGDGELGDNTTLALPSPTPVEPKW